MAHVGVEFAVALDQRREPVGIVVERSGELADFVLGEMRRKRFGFAGLAQRADALRQDR